MRGLTRVLVVVLVLVALGAGISLLVSARRGAAAAMRAQLLGDVDRGGLSDLARAQILARRLLVTDPDDREVAAALAFTDAALVVDYGLDVGREARTLLARWDRGAGKTKGKGKAAEPGGDEDDLEGSGDVTKGMMAAARALLLASTGDRAGAIRAALAAATVTPGVPYPLYALGRVRALSGDLSGAVHALQAGIVRTPNFLGSRVAWAEARLDLGDPKAARASLEAVLKAAPDDLRARLLLDEAEQALGMAATGTLGAACAADSATGTSQDGGPPPTMNQRWPPAAIRSACALAAATHARRGGTRAEALAHAEHAASLVPNQARLLGRTALLLAQLGPVDWAAGILERARKVAAPEMPALAWATLAVTLGRGRVPKLPAGARPTDPETRLLVARVTLSTAGVAALASVVDSFDPSIVASDRDLRLLAKLGHAADPAPAPAPAPAPGTADEPLRDYVDGLRAKLDGDLPTAVAKFQRALSGHGDACRAAGEYVATMGLLKRPVPVGALATLRAENTGCVNVR